MSTNASASAVPGRLHARVALVTGASQGIGALLIVVDGGLLWNDSEQ